MNNEYNNMLYYYNNYNNNEYVVIPKPILSKQNFLLMEFIHGESIDDINVSEFEKQKIILLFNMFCKNNYMFLEYFHGDLHQSNWKVRKYNNFYQLIVFDFGYIIHTNQNDFFKEMLIACDLNDMEKLGILLYNTIINNNNTIKEFLQDFLYYMNTVFSPEMSSTAYDIYIYKYYIRLCYYDSFSND